MRRWSETAAWRRSSARRSRSALVRNTGFAGSVIASAERFMVVAAAAAVRGRCSEGGGGFAPVRRAIDLGEQSEGRVANQGWSYRLALVWVVLGQESSANTGVLEDMGPIPSKEDMGLILSAGLSRCRHSQRREFDARSCHWVKFLYKQLTSLREREAEIRFGSRLQRKLTIYLAASFLGKPVYQSTNSKDNPMISSETDE